MIHLKQDNKVKCGSRPWRRSFNFLVTEDKSKVNCKRCLGTVKPRSKNTNTVNRYWLKQQIIKGRVMAKCNGKYTDDYAFDAAYNYQQTEWLPARISSLGRGRQQEGCISFDESDFRGFGHAWKQPDNTICLSFGWCSYDFKVINS